MTLGHSAQSPGAGALARALGWMAFSSGMLALSPAHAGADCSITSVGLHFGIYDALATQPDDVATSITVTCVYVAPGTTSVQYSIAISNGLNGSSPVTRRMASGASRLGYNVYQDAARSNPWGTGTAGAVVASGSMTVGPGVGNGTRIATHVVYGRVPALQAVEPGTYLDTLLLTLTY
jgi:spore coat protein U domain-containing protein, fimbrial subunit CupE1/2/3/6